MNSRQMVPYNWHACRGTELCTTHHRITAHLLLLSTFPDLATAKTLITTTVSMVYGPEVQEARRELGIVKIQRLFSEGHIALTFVVDEALDARSEVGDDGEVDGAMARLGELFFKLGLVEVNERRELVDGPRIKKVRKVLEQRGHGPHSLVMKSLALENILLVWLNFALSDEEMKEEVPSLAGDQCQDGRRASVGATTTHASSHAGLRALFLGRVRHGRAGEVPAPPREALGEGRGRFDRSGGGVAVNEMEALCLCVRHCAYLQGWALRARGARVILRESSELISLAYPWCLLGCPGSDSRGPDWNSRFPRPSVMARSMSETIASLSTAGRLPPRVRVQKTSPPCSWSVSTMFRSTGRPTAPWRRLCPARSVSAGHESARKLTVRRRRAVGRTASRPRII